MTQVRIIRPADEALEIGTAATHLTSLVWPPAAGTVSSPEAIAERWKSRTATHFVLEKDGEVLAHAKLFRREIFTEQGPLLVGALAAVCVHPDYRGRGWGADVVRAAFDYLPELGLEVSLFQTPVPDFYAKLGCRIVQNSFFDGTRADGVKENPFWDICEMIYPANFSWPDGEIDLNGPGY